MIKLVLILATTLLWLFPLASGQNVYSEISITVLNRIGSGVGYSACTSVNPSGGLSPEPLFCQVTSFSPPYASFYNVSLNSTSFPQLAVIELGSGCPTECACVWPDTYTFNPNNNGLVWTDNRRVQCACSVTG